jgi:hypothetical protein
MPHGVRHPDRETDRRSQHRERAAGTPARMIRMPPVPAIWIPGQGWAPAPDHPAGRNPAGAHARERRGCRSRPSRLRPPGRRRMRLPGASISLFRHHTERRGRSGRTHAVPPFWSASGSQARSNRDVHNRWSCVTWPRRVRYGLSSHSRQRTGGEANGNPITLCHGHPLRLRDCHLPIAPIGLTWSAPGVGQSGLRQAFDDLDELVAAVAVLAG